MANQYTPNARLAKPAWHDRRYDIVVGGNFDLLDAMTALGGLCVAPAESPSASLNVAVSAGSYSRSDEGIGSYAGASPVAVPPSATTCLWIDGSGALAQGVAFPAAPHLRLAIITTDAAKVTAVADARIQCAMLGTPETSPIVTKTSAYTAADPDGTIKANATGGAFTITLPTAGGRSGRSFIIKKSDATANVVTVASAGGTIDGAASYALSAPYQSVTVESDGVEWSIIAKV